MDWLSRLLDWLRNFGAPGTLSTEDDALDTPEPDDPPRSTP